MNMRSVFTLITAATAVAALAAGLMLAIHAPAPAGEDFGQPQRTASASPDDA